MLMNSDQSLSGENEQSRVLFLLLSDQSSKPEKLKSTVAYLVNALGEDHATEDILQVGDGLSLEGAAEIVELLPAALVLELDPLALLALLGGGPRGPPAHPPLERSPRDLHDLRLLVPDPRLHPALYRLHRITRVAEIPTVSRKNEKITVA